MPKHRDRQPTDIVAQTFENVKALRQKKRSGKGKGSKLPG
jgi:hypothetical protein